jgi:hypothetical protein
MNYNRFAVDYSPLQNTITSALDAPQRMEESALRAEEARIKRQQYEAYQKPVPIDQFTKSIPDWMRKPMMEVAQQGGLVEQNGKDVFIRAGKIQELRKEIKNNDILKAQMYEKSLAYASQEEEQNNQVLPKLEAKFSPLLQSEQAKIKNMVVKTKNEYGQEIEIPDTLRQTEAQKKLDATLNQIPEYVEHQKLSKRNMDLKSNRMRGVWRMGLLDKEFEKNAEEFGMEGAIQIAENREMKNVFLAQRERDKYRIKMQEELPGKIAMEREKQENKRENDKTRHEDRLEENKQRELDRRATIEATKNVNGGGGSKETDKVVNRINSDYIKKYERIISDLEKKKDKLTMDDPSAAEIDKKIEYYKRGIEDAEDTRSKLLNGEIKNVVWPKNNGSAPKAQAQPKTQTQAKSLDVNTASAILKEAGGNKEKARLIAKKRGYTF